MIPIEKEPAAWEDNTGVLEHCFFCKAGTNTWHKKTNTPVCKKCAKSHKVKDLKVLDPQVTEEEKIREIYGLYHVNGCGDVIFYRREKPEQAGALNVKGLALPNGERIRPNTMMQCGSCNKMLTVHDLKLANFKVAENVPQVVLDTLDIIDKE